MPEILAQRLYIKAIERITSLEEHVEKLEAELHLLKTSGIAEVAVRNPSVVEYIKHWEGRAEAAEAKLAKAVEALESVMIGGYDVQHIRKDVSDARIAEAREEALREALDAAREYRYRRGEAVENAILALIEKDAE